MAASYSISIFVIALKDAEVFFFLFLNYLVYGPSGDGGGRECKFAPFFYIIFVPLTAHIYTRWVKRV